MLLNYLMIILQFHLRLNSKFIPEFQGIPSMSARAACSKVSDYSNLKILSPKRSPIASENTSEMK